MVLGFRAMPSPTILPSYFPTQSHLVLLLLPWICLSASHHPGIVPDLPLSQILRGVVKGFDAFPDWQVSWKIVERPHQTTHIYPCPVNATDDVYPLEILVSRSRVIAHLLLLPTCVASFCPAKYTHMLGYPKIKLLGVVVHHLSTASQSTKSNVVIFILPFCSSNYLIFLLILSSRTALPTPPVIFLPATLYMIPSYGSASLVETFCFYSSRTNGFAMAYHL